MRADLSDVLFEPTPATKAFMASLGAGEVAEAVTVLDQHWLEVWFAIDPSDLKNLLLSLPASAFDRFANATYLNQLVGTTLADPATAPPPGNDPERRLAELGRRGGQLRTAGRPAAAMELVPEGARLARQVRGQLVDTSEGSMAVWMIQVGITALLAGDLVTARINFLEAQNSRRPARFPFVEREGAAKLALTHAIAGDLQQAAACAERARQQPRTASWVEQLVDHTVTLVDYIGAVDALDLDRAEELRLATPSPLSHLEFWGPALIVQVRHLCLTGRAGEARELCDEVAAMGLPLPDSDGWVAAMLNDARLLCQSPWEVPTAPEPHTSYVELLARRTHLVATGQYDELQLQSGGAPSGMPRDARTRLGLELLRGQALLLSDRAGDGRRIVLDTLGEVLTRGTCSVLRHLTRETLDLVADSEAGERACQLVKEYDVALVEVQHVLRSPLTPAEEKVMDLLSLGLSRAQIAADAFVSVETVKSQLTSAYRKLGAQKRSDAIAKFLQFQR